MDRIKTAAAHTPGPRYVPLLRPAGYATLPAGVAWEYVEVPRYITKRPDLPTSNYPHGIIATARPLTADECERFDLRAAP